MSPVRLDVTERVAFAGSHAFGESGAYEKLRGRAHFALDPATMVGSPVTDLVHAPRDEDGLVRFAADFFLLKPLEGGNRRLFFDWGNRGNKRALQFFNDAPASNDPTTLADAGNGFLFRRGYAVAWVAWQGDLWPGDGRMVLDAPTARGPEGSITGVVRREFIVESEGITSLPLSGMISVRSYPAVSLDTTRAKLTKRRYADDPPEPVLASAWRFAREERGQGLDAQGVETALVPSPTHIWLEGGFRPGWIYELLYEAKDPMVLGLGFVAVRDCLAFLRNEPDEAVNPLAARVDKVFGWGRSQTGRAMREFIYQGFNEDAGRRRLFDGVMPHVSGAGRMWLNHRFAQGSAMAGQQYEAHQNFSDRFPFSYAETTDHLTGKSDALLKRPATDPLVLHTQSATEYWQRRGSLVHTDTQGRDLEQPANVRVYLWASSQHFAPVAKARPQRGPCQNPTNVVATSPFFRALLDALDRWASDGVPPPATRVPRRADGTLVAFDEWKRQFPLIPGGAVPAAANSLPLLDYGPEEDQGLLAEPPKLVDQEGYAILVPAVDADGNDIAGIRAPIVAAPLATYTGWNLRAESQGKGALHQFTGSTIAFAATMSERHMTSDPRCSVEERYKGAAAYQAAIRSAAETLRTEGFLLEEDVERIVAEAADWDRPRHTVDL